jgi:hypothetical protein
LPIIIFIYEVLFLFSLLPGQIENWGIGAGADIHPNCQKLAHIPSSHRRPTDIGQHKTGVNTHGQVAAHADGGDGGQGAEDAHIVLLYNGKRNVRNAKM